MPTSHTGRAANSTSESHIITPVLPSYPAGNCQCHASDSIVVVSEGFKILFCFPCLRWFLNDIASVDRTTYPWLIINIHVPFYHTYLDQYKVNEVRAHTPTGLPWPAHIYSSKLRLSWTVTVGALR